MSYTKTIVTNIRDAIAAGSSVVGSAKSELIWLLPPQMLGYGVQFGLTDKSKELIRKGGRVRGITHISKPYLDPVRALLDIGEDVRHVNEYQGEFMLVADNRESISSTPQQNVDAERLSLDDTVIGFWTDDPSYAKFLVTIFETSWKDAVDGSTRMRALEVP